MKTCIVQFKSLLKSVSGSVMLEYIIITGLFMMGVGGLVYFDGSYVNLFTNAMPLETDSTWTPMMSIYTLSDSSGETDGHLNLIPVFEADRELKTYGMLGDSWSAQTKTALRVVSMPLP